MIMQRWAVLVLLVGGCTEEPSSDESGDSGQSNTTSGSEAGTTQGTAPATDDTGGTTMPGTTDDSADSDTGEEPTSDSSSSGGEPPGSAGCMAEVNLAEGEHQFMLDGFDRRYIVRLPQNYSNDQPWPLIFALHGNGGNPGYWDDIGGDRDIRTAFETEAIIIIPEAINNAWRDYEAGPDTWPEFIGYELNYFDTIHQTALEELCIDPDNVFSMGFSGGGSFSGLLGCRRDYIRAIAVGGSVIYFDPEEACESTPAAWITIGEGEFTDGRAAYRDFFRDLAGCDASSMPGEPGGCENYDACGPDTPVTYCSHPAGHVWPSIGTDATKAFFQQFYLAE